MIELTQAGSDADEYTAEKQCPAVSRLLQPVLVAPDLPLDDVHLTALRATADAFERTATAACTRLQHSLAALADGDTPKVRPALLCYFVRVWGER